MRFSRNTLGNVLSFWVNDGNGREIIGADWFIDDDGRLYKFDSYVDGVPETPQLLCEAYRFLEEKNYEES